MLKNLSLYKPNVSFKYSLTTEWADRWTLRIFKSGENLMDKTGPLSSIRKEHFKLSLCPFTTTPVAPPERTANTCQSISKLEIIFPAKIKLSLVKINAKYLLIGIIIKYNGYFGPRFKTNGVRAEVEIQIFLSKSQFFSRVFHHGIMSGWSLIFVYSYSVFLDFGRISSDT